MTDDPIRLRDEGSDFLKKALASARADVPDAERAAALEARILPLLLPPPAPPTPPTPPAPAGAAGAGASSGGLVAAKGLFSLKAAAVGLASLALVGGAAIAVTRAPSASPLADPRPAASVVSAARPEAPPAPSALVPLDVIEAAEAPSAPAPVSSAPRVPAPSAPVAPRASAEVNDLAAEAALLRAAQDGLRGNPSEALARASEHARRFPRGALTQEREAIAIEALVKLGRGAEARARADRFAKSFPGSTHQRRLDALVGR